MALGLIVNKNSSADGLGPEIVNKNNSADGLGHEIVDGLGAAVFIVLAGV